MKRLLTIMLVGAMLCAAAPAFAQREDKFFSAGFGLEGGLPLGNTSNYYNFETGVTARFALHVGPGFATFTAGGIILPAKSLPESDLKAAVQMPFKFGYKYPLVGPLFVMGEIGYSSFLLYYDNGTQDYQHTSTGGFTYSPAVGVNLGVTELSMRYESVILNGGNLSYLGFRAGFNF